jgi:hypothetical protein
MPTLAPVTRPPSYSASPTLTLSLAAANVPPKTITVKSLAEARAEVKAFIARHDISAAEYNSSLAGRIDRDGIPYCRVSYHGKLWALDEAGRETFREMSDRGEVMP